jgi:hypothetical protein
MPLPADRTVWKDPLSAVAVFDDALLCVADGQCQALSGREAEVLREAVHGVLSLRSVATTRKLTPDEAGLLDALIDRLVQLGMLNARCVEPEPATASAGERSP